MSCIVQVPSCYFIKLSSGDWINLAAIRKVATFDHVLKLIKVYWANGDHDLMVGASAQEIIKGCEEAAEQVARSLSDSPA